MKAWLKGGLIGLVLDLVLILFVTLTSSPKEAIFLALTITQLFPYLLLYGGDSVPNIFLIMIIGLLTYFIIGAILGVLIGFIVRKIKQRNQKTYKL